MNKIILIVLSVALLILAFGGGYVFKTIQASPQIKKAETVVKDLSSKTVLSAVVYGQVSKIEGRDITLSYNGDSIKINITDTTPIYSFANDFTGKSVQKKVDFKDIKIGNTLNITIKILPDGQMQSQSVLVLLSIPSSK